MAKSPSGEAGWWRDRQAPECEVPSMPRADQFGLGAEGSGWCQWLSKGKFLLDARYCAKFWGYGHWLDVYGPYLYAGFLGTILQSQT